ncbi:MAG: hypothetical protein GXP60_04915 [Epsilonproteobacteria bacterium]|nr:hypothetical protein [Campylobacterota bacterium]
MKFKITFIIFIVLVVSLIITLNIFFQKSYETEIAEQVNRQQLLIARAVSGSIEDFIFHTEDKAVAIAQLIGLRGINSNGLCKFIGYTFAELHEEIPLEVTVFNSKGDIVGCSKNRFNKVGITRFLMAKFRGLKSGEILFPDKLKRDRNLYLITPIVNKSRKFAGGLLIKIKISDISKRFLKPIKSGKRGYAWMMDGYGTLLYHPTKPGMIGRNIYRADKLCYKCHESFKAEKEILNARDIGYKTYIAPYGEDKLVAFSRIKFGRPNWIVCVSIPYSEVIENIKHSMRFYSALIIFIFFVTGIVALIVIIINRKRIKAEEKSLYMDEIKKQAKKLERLVSERTVALSSEKEKLHALISSIRAGICIFDNSKKMIWCNKVMNEWLSEERRRNFTLDFFKDGRDVSKKIYDTSSGNKHVQEVLYLDFGDKEGYFQISATPLYLPDEQATLLLIQDITDLKKAEEQLMHSEKLAALSRLSAGVAHEIGNPLTSISSYVQILKNMDNNDFTKDALETIYKHIQRIATIVLRMSGFSKNKTEKMKSLGVKKLIQSTIDITRYDRRTKKIDIQLNMPDNLPEIYIDEDQLTQVFMNLILNAADAMPEGGSLIITGQSNDKEVSISFKDTGPGIAKNHLEKIFEPFFTTKDKGTGLGLAVSYTIVKNYGGRIDVESLSDKGANFIVRLPVYESK